MITIRKFTLEDVGTTFVYSSDHENTYYMLNSPFTTPEETHAFLVKCIEEYDKEHPRYISFAVIYEGVHVGEVFATISEQEAIIGWLISKQHWGKGIATHAARLLIDYLKSELHLSHLISYCDARNIASKRVMEKLGMRFVGTNGARNYEKNVTPGEELKYEMEL